VVQLLFAVLTAFGLSSLSCTLFRASYDCCD